MAYLSREYAESFQTMGRVKWLPDSGGWLLDRPIPGTDCRDAMGGYPLFMCRNWALLSRDLEGLGNGLLAVSMVPDPFGPYELQSLVDCFTDVCRPYKVHYVVELKGNWEAQIHRHHRRNARSAARKVDVERCSDPVCLLDDWCRLYGELVTRHGIRGMTRFSEECFRGQLQVPGIEAFRALDRGSPAGIVLWYRHEDVAYYHLGASSRKGYALGASFALFHAALRYFSSERLRWVDLGGSAGTGPPRDDGLGRFKSGWANSTRTAYFCGRVLNRPRYRALAASSGRRESGYFPAYREGEFN